ncbi:MAG TPA: CAP domain-containing protein [Thermoanaerobaculia bacterium]|nr:CAP domain-containing protein [Thermoanaerobaculia bacterium]
MIPWVRWSVCALALAFGLPAARAQTVEEWLARFNRARAEADVPPLRLSPVLTQVAQQHAEEIARIGRSPRSAEAIAERLRQVGYSAYDWREDFVYSEVVPDAMLPGLLRKPGVQAALDKHFRDLGVGTALVGGVPLYVFLFGWHQGDYFALATAPLGEREQIAAEMLARVNAERSRFGAPPVASNPLLDRISQEHAEDMLARSYSGHRTPEGLGPTDRARAGGYLSGIGENLVEQRFSVEEALDAWLGSPAHRRILLDPGCREMGLGLAVGAGYDAAPGAYRVIWVQSFGRGN